MTLVELKGEVTKDLNIIDDMKDLMENTPSEKVLHMAHDVSEAAKSHLEIVRLSIVIEEMLVGIGRVGYYDIN
jgi:hypothetical protein